MKKFNHIILGLAISAALFSSCNNLLDEKNPNLVTTDKVVTTLDGIESVNRGMYTALPTSLQYYVPSLITDEFVFPSAGSNLGGGIGEYNWVYGPGTVTDRDDNGGLFLGFYSAVKRANTTLLNVDNIAVSTTADTNRKNLLKAEALGMRALAHYYVLMYFSPKYDASALGCAYVTDLDDYATPSRLSMKDSYDRINADLDNAISIFPATVTSGYGGTFGNNRLTKAALYAIKARVALETGNYDAAIANATSALSGRSLTPSANYSKVWDDSNDYQEVIFKQSNIAGAGGTPGQLIYNTQNQVQWNASATLLNKFNTGDIRASLFTTLSGANGVIPVKYLLPNMNGVKPTRGLADVKLFRTSEMYLIRSEAYARKSDLTSALVDYTLLRTARVAGASLAFTSQQDALDKILDERARELCYEGVRLSDIKRLGKTIVRVAADSRPGYTTLTFTDVDKYTLPIPQATAFANPNLTQNVGWR
ncbi:RagB/SusD family nutrient uptake outer membrane protein [Elizabethkingia ursingii]|uniref:RagB/SusD family nutrient uptake outer membrane protein n=1 Tax=Elizabethkingia ursingii TaxID=1756150 RepID=UPI000750E7B0|nr:RagB/SusD family nutrient uptake outer membrane protein [Elizabethkingia ursingii]KUY26150.1 hypothetical protein ATB96_05245 [Elizabethkingia ursingii]MCL1673417.1 RagB/SusD family nutrient uptake outer membrane protein [Elizabethkingia ursingii]